MLKYKAMQLFCCSLANQLINKSANYFIKPLANLLFIFLFSIFAFNSFSQNSLDNLTYNYKPNTNQLKYITDVAGSVIPGVDLDNQTNNNNYTYNANGQLIKDVAEGILDIDWTTSGKVKQVNIDDNGDFVADRSLQFMYDEMDNRIKKTETNLTTNSPILTTYYMRNATGELISVYEDVGSGVDRKEMALAIGTDKAALEVISNGISTRNIGFKNYELKDHLGNVRVVINDVKEPNPGVLTFTCNIIHSTDYYSYGMQMPGRDYSSNSYRYGYQGKEKDNELKGDGNSYDFGARLLDPRVGRWLSLDPKAGQFAGMSPYNAMANNPIAFVDPDGQAPSSSEAQALVSMLNQDTYRGAIPLPVSEAEVYDELIQGLGNSSDPGMLHHPFYEGDGGHWNASGGRFRGYDHLHVGGIHYPVVTSDEQLAKNRAHLDADALAKAPAGSSAAKARRGLASLGVMGGIAVTGAEVVYVMNGQNSDEMQQRAFEVIGGDIFGGMAYGALGAPSVFISLEGDNPESIEQNHLNSQAMDILEQEHPEAIGSFFSVRYVHSDAASMRAFQQAYDKISPPQDVSTDIDTDDDTDEYLDNDD